MLLDVNVLVYWSDSTSPLHEVVRRLIHQADEAGDAIGVPWITVLGWLRVVTNPKIPRSIPMADGIDDVGRLLARDTVWHPQAGPRHWEILSRLVADAQLSGGGITDAHLAALAIEHDLMLVSFDRGFGRFAGLRWFNPATP
ncbi:MAG: TA system VapC family ribonuclease toxin [Dehalococcoidia bacterium]